MVERYKYMYVHLKKFFLGMPTAVLEVLEIPQFEIFLMAMRGNKEKKNENQQTNKQWNCSN